MREPNLTEPVDMLTLLLGGIIKSNLSQIPPKLPYDEP
jgi:hypothetical protein